MKTDFPLDTATVSSFDPVHFLLDPSEKSHIPLVYVRKLPQIDREKPFVFVMIGPGGSGKDIVTAPVVTDGTLVQVRTATTRTRRVAQNEDPERYVWMRKPNDGESDDEYVKNLISEYSLIEHNFFNGFIYGVPMAELESATKRGTPVLVIDPNGAARVLKMLGEKMNVVVVFVVPDNYEVLWARIKGRENVEQRMKISVEEIRMAPEVAHYYLYNPVEFEGKPGLQQAQKSLKQLVLEMTGETKGL